jgi:hypothetical protein
MTANIGAEKKKLSMPSDLFDCTDVYENVLNKKCGAVMVILCFTKTVEYSHESATNTA